MKIECTFVPQRWNTLKKDNAYPTDPEGPTTWDLDMAEVTELTGVTDMANMDDDPYARDELRHAQSSPQWVKDWSGPFEVEWEVQGTNT